MSETKRYIACSFGKTFHIVDTVVRAIFPTEYDDRKTAEREARKENAKLDRAIIQKRKN